MFSLQRTPRQAGYTRTTAAIKEASRIVAASALADLRTQKSRTEIVKTRSSAHTALGSPTREQVSVWNALDHPPHAGEPG